MAGLAGGPTAQAQPAAVDGLYGLTGTSLTSPSVLGPWGTRLGWADAAAAADSTFASPVTARLSWQWLNDYRFTAVGGLRVTGGLLGWLDRGTAGTPTAMSGGAGAPLRLPSSARPGGTGGIGGAFLMGDNGLGAAPYLGLGYDSASTLHKGWGGWGLSADVGWVTRHASANPSGLRLGTQAESDEGWRSQRLAPMVQLGVSYAF